MFVIDESRLLSLILLAVGAGGLTVANQIFDRFMAAGKPLNEGDHVIVDGADNHYYQVRSKLPKKALEMLTALLLQPGWSVTC